MTKNLNFQKSLRESLHTFGVCPLPIHCMQDNCLSKQHMSNYTGSITNHHASIHQQRTSSIVECSPVSGNAFMDLHPKQKHNRQYTSHLIFFRLFFEFILFVDPVYILIFLPFRLICRQQHVFAILKQYFLSLFSYL